MDTFLDGSLLGFVVLVCHEHFVVEGSCLDFTLEWSFRCRRCCYEFPVKFLCLFCTNYHFLFSFCLLLPALLLSALGIVFCFGNCRNSNSSTFPAFRIRAKFHSPAIAFRSLVRGENYHFEIFRSDFELSLSFPVM